MSTSLESEYCCCMPHFTCYFLLRAHGCQCIRKLARTLSTVLTPPHHEQGGNQWWCLTPQSYQTFCPVLAAELLGIMLRNRCWFITFHIITIGNVYGWYHKWPVWSTFESHSPRLLYYLWYMISPLKLDDVTNLFLFNNHGYYNNNPIEAITRQWASQANDFKIFLDT